MAGIEAALAAGLRKAYPLSTSKDAHLEERLANTFQDAAFFYRATDPARNESELSEWMGRMDEVQGAQSMGLLYPPRLPPGLDVANVKARVWFHPAGDGRQSHEGIEELFAKAILDGQPAVGAFMRLVWRSKMLSLSLFSIRATFFRQAIQ